GDGPNFFVDQPVGGENDRAAKLIRVSGEICDFATGFFDQQNARGGIPFRKSEFPEAVEATRRDRGKVERAGAIAPYAVRALREIAVVLKIGAGFAVSHGKTSAEEAGRKRGDLGDTNLLAVKRGAFAQGVCEMILVKSIENDL